MNFHCQICADKPSVRAKCRREAELKAKKDAELLAKARLERDRLERGQADELAGAMNEFFTALYTGNANAASTPDMSAYMASSFSDLPLSSPDSITVTTEFGVLEETGNVTIISAGGATHLYDPYDEHSNEYDDETEYQHHENELEEQGNYVVMTEDTSAGSPDWVTAVALQHQQQQSAWLLNQQMQNMYNIAMGSNTTPPPVQHAAPVVHHQEDELNDDDEEDTGEEADVDTDEVEQSADDGGVDGTMTPIANHIATQLNLQG